MKYVKHKSTLNMTIPSTEVVEQQLKVVNYFKVVSPS